MAIKIEPHRFAELARIAAERLAKDTEFNKLLAARINEAVLNRVENPEIDAAIGLMLDIYHRFYKGGKIEGDKLIILSALVEIWGNKADLKSLKESNV